MLKGAPLVTGIIAGMVFMALLIGGYHLSAEPGLCIACHSMHDVGSTWQMSNHKQFECVECHLPPSNTVAKVFYKMRIGLHDLWHETIRDYPASLAASQSARTIAGRNCVRCHHSTMERVSAFSGTQPDCMKCHRRIVHRARKDIGE
jgi:cytochrome c nitrite reductase small subunit